MAKQSTSLMQLNMNDELQVQDFIGGVLPGSTSRRCFGKLSDQLLEFE